MTTEEIYNAMNAIDKAIENAILEQDFIEVARLNGMYNELSNLFLDSMNNQKSDNNT